MFHIDNDLVSDTKLYRYISVESFISFVETRLIRLSNVNSWDDKWEVILSKIPTVNDDDKEIKPIYSFYEYIYGQCWSLQKDSDAMWRIYSPSKTGLQITTSVDKFRLISGLKRCHVEKVVYFETIKELLEKTAAYKSPFKDALFKRVAFEHEREVRVLTHMDFMERPKSNRFGINLSLDNISEFIESVTVDPRADDWFVNTIAKYCERIGLEAKPIKSSLYESDPHLKVGLVRKFVNVKQ